MKMRRVLPQFLALWLLLVGPVPPTAVAEDEFPTVPYVLLEDSTYQEGCFEGCACPIGEEQPLEGTFDLVFYPFEGPLWTVAVEHVDWKVPSLGLEVTGSGTYVRAGEQQRLQLELSINGGPPASFDSGWVSDDTYPEIEILISMNQLFCYDEVFRLHAAPVATPVLTLGVARSELSWTAMPGDPLYDVVCGDLDALRVAGDFTVSTDLCLASGEPGTTLPYSLDAEAAQGFWFLVREQGGTYDTDSGSQVAPRDPGIDASAAGCP